MNPIAELLAADATTMNEPLTESAPPPMPPAPPMSLGRMTLLLIAAYLAFSMLLPLPQIHPERLSPGVQLLLVWIPTAAFMLLQLGLTRALVALRVPPLPSLVAAVIALAGWGLTLYAIHPDRHLPFAANVFLQLLRMTLLGLTLTLSLAFFGTLLARIIREKNLLLPVALVAMPIDYVGAMTKIGFTNHVEKVMPRVAQAVSVPVPALSTGAHIGPVGYIGTGDVLFMAFFFAVVQTFRMNEKGTFWWMYGLLTAAMLIVLSPFGFNIAALVPMGMAVLIANWRSFTLTRDESLALLYASLLVFAVVGGFYLYSHHAWFHGK